MKRIALMAAAAALLLSGVAVASLPSLFWYEMATCPGGTAGRCIAAQTCTAGTCTAAAPVTSTQGLALGGARAFRVTVCAVSAQTLSGAGSMQAYLYNSAEGAWSRDVDLDLAMSVTATSCAGAACRCQTWADLQVGPGYDRVRYVSNGVTVSGGATLDVILDGQTVSVSR